MNSGDPRCQRSTTEDVDPFDELKEEFRQLGTAMLLDPERKLPTIEEVKEALKRAAPAANELNRMLEPVFRAPQGPDLILK